MTMIQMTMINRLTLLDHPQSHPQKFLPAQLPALLLEQEQEIEGPAAKHPVHPQLQEMIGPNLNHLQDLNLAVQLVEKIDLPEEEAAAPRSLPNGEVIVVLHILLEDEIVALHILLDVVIGVALHILPKGEVIVVLHIHLDLLDAVDVVHHLHLGDVLVEVLHLRQDEEDIVALQSHAEKVENILVIKHIEDRDRTDLDHEESNNICI